VLAANPRLAFAPGSRYLYSNIGYWLLGKVVEKASGAPYTDYVRQRILKALSISPRSMDFVIPRPAFHAGGYLGRYTVLNLLKNRVMDSRFWVGYEGRWLRFADHHLDGPAFGGLVGTARALGSFLRDQLREEPVLLRPETALLMRSRQTDNRGRPLPMTLGWHAAERKGTACLFKQGGGGGFRCEMRLYPSRGRASVIMANGTRLDTAALLDRVDSAFFPA
jgi:CubicO group peptidase (beta-lactamase class C family)